MPRVTRRVFLTTASLAAAGASGAAWALRAQAQARPLKIGLLLDYTGSMGPFGPTLETGAQLAVRQFNAAGGVLGQPVQLITAGAWRARRRWLSQ